MFQEPNQTYQMKQLRRYSYEMGPFRPPSEGQSQSILIRASRHCSWNRCKFCISDSKTRPKFEYRNTEELKQDIDTIRGIADEIKEASWKLGYKGQVNSEVINTIVQSNPEIYGRDATDLWELEERLQCLIHIANWIDSGCRTAFLQDSNSLIIRTPDLVNIIKYLKGNFPAVERVTTYGRSKTCYKKSAEELEELQEVGLSRIHVGFESGCDEILSLVDKGVTAEEQIAGGKKVVAAGISLSEYVMPGLGGKKWSEKQALESACALNEINPAFIRLRSLSVRKDSPLFRLCQSGEFEPLTETEMVDEIGLFLENLNCEAYVTSDHIWNILMDVEGQLPQDKDKMLDIIRRYQKKTPMEKLAFNLSERLKYWNMPDEPEIRQLVHDAQESIRNETPDAESRVEKATAALKQKGG